MLLIGVLAISHGAIFAKLAGAHPVTASLWRCAVGALVFLPFALFVNRGTVKALRGAGYKLVLAGAALAAHFVGFLGSLELTSVAVSVVLVNTAPLWTTLIAWATGAKQLRASLALGVLIAFAGASWLVLQGAAADRQESLPGMGLALFSAAMLAVYLSLGKSLSQSLTLPQYALGCYGIASGVLACWVFAVGAPWGAPSLASAGWLVAMGVVAQGIGHSSLNWCLKRASAPMVSASMLGEPVGATLLAWAVFQQVPGWQILLAGGCILFGLNRIARSEFESARASAESQPGR